MNNDTRFVYLRDDKNDVTVAYRYDDERRVIEFNVARRNKRDQFIKAVGREIAAGRLEKKGGYSVPYAAIESFVEAHNESERDWAGYLIAPDLIENPHGYRAVAAFIHSFVNPKVQPFDPATMYTVLTRDGELVAMPF